MIVTAWSQKKGKRLCAKWCVKHKTDWKAFKIIALIRINNLLKINIASDQITCFALFQKGT